MNTTALTAQLKTEYLGSKITTFDTVNSTNTQAKHYNEKEGVHHGHMFIAEKQSDGRGTDGNTWESQRGNIYLSVTFDYRKPIDTTFSLYPAVALAMVLNDTYKIPAHVKWPNDVLIGKHKIAGILCEGAFNQYTTMGIGINVNQRVFAPHLQDIATSVYMQLNEEVELEAFTAHFLNAYEALFYSDTDIIKAWLSLTQMVGKTIHTTQDGVEKKVTVLGLSPEGFLSVKLQDGNVENWMARSGLDIDVHY